MVLDVLIKNGLVVDGTGNPWFRADVGVKDGRIVRVSRVVTEEADRVVNADGLVVAPGFIDLHNHSDMIEMAGSILLNRTAKNLVMQGITTVATGNCGYSAAPLSEGLRERFRERVAKAVRAGVISELVEIDWLTMHEWMSRVENAGVSVNIAPFIGFGTVRESVMSDPDRVEPTEEELKEIKSMVREAMKDGAFGMTTGLEYYPQCNATVVEIVELLKVVAEYGGVYMSHIRSEDDYLIEAVREHIRICRLAGVPCCISHHKACGYRNWGKVYETVRLIEEARKEGVEMICDCYPWESAAVCNLGELLVPDPVSREELLKYFKDDVKWEEIKEEAKKRLYQELKRNEEMRKVLGRRGSPYPIVWDPRTYHRIVYSKSRPDLVWKNFSEVAEILEVEDPWEAMRKLYIADDGETRVCIGDMREEDIIAVLKQSWTAVSTDASADEGCRGLHPRSYGTYPKLFQRYVRELRIFSLEEAVRKATSLPAQFLGLKDRGLIKEGFAADIVVFDPRKIECKATYASPCRYPEGVRYVLVNGVLVVDEGEHTGELPGKVLKHQ
ncbi:MAG: D-aminoacylase [Desulfurococcales archaeon]|nr:D-aminoacylase [Desulfurococcales archaeon]